MTLLKENNTQDNISSGQITVIDVLKSLTVRLNNLEKKMVIASDQQKIDTEELKIMRNDIENLNEAYTTIEDRIEIIESNQNADLSPLLNSTLFSGTGQSQLSDSPPIIDDSKDCCSCDESPCSVLKLMNNIASPDKSDDKHTVVSDTTTKNENEQLRNRIGELEDSLAAKESNIMELKTQIEEMEAFNESISEQYHKIQDEISELTVAKQEYEEKFNKLQTAMTGIW